MKRGIHATTVPAFRQRRPAQLAERELQHLEMILANFVEHNTAPERLPASYWDMRIAQLDADYDLVPTQSQRVISLQRKLALLDSALDATPFEANEQDGNAHDDRRRRAAA
ncbi:hypothetical protein AWB71_05166 [Caballeronia peredens]|nr:hypothetical protein AWB71_05166 [Caballeronia peredens]